MHSAPPHTAQTLPASATTRRSSGTCGRCSAGTSASTTPSRRPPAQPGAHAVPVQLAPRRRPAKPGIDTTRRPGLSVKLASWHSDVSQPGRGNLKLVLGSHLVNWIDGPRGACFGGRHTEQMLDGIASVAPPHTALKWSAIGTAPVDDEDS